MANIVLFSTNQTADNSSKTEAYSGPAKHVWLSFFRSSRPEVLCKKGVLEISQYSQENTCVRESFLNKVAGLRPATLLKKSLWHRCLPVNFAKFLRIPFFTEHVRWLLLLFYENSWWLVVKKLHHRFLRGFEIYLRQLLQLHKNTTL